GWVPASPSITVRSSDRGFVFEGDGSQFGYQVMGPRLRVAPSAKVDLKIQLNVEKGSVCIGVLNGTEQGWLVPPDRAANHYAFDVDTSGNFRVVLANCKSAPGSEASRASLDLAEFSSDLPAFYADRLIEASLGHVTAK